MQNLKLNKKSIKSPERPQFLKLFQTNLALQSKVIHLYPSQNYILMTELQKVLNVSTQILFGLAKASLRL